MEFRFPLLVLALGPCESVKAFDDGEFRPCAVHCLGEPYGRMVLGLLDELTVESFGCFACFFMADGFQNLFLAHWNAELVHDLGEAVVRFGQSVRVLVLAYVLQGDVELAGKFHDLRHRCFPHVVSFLPPCH